jgi:cytoskeletal protein RodZ
MQIFKSLSIVVISAFAIVTIHSAFPSEVNAQVDSIQEVNPESEFVPDDDTQYPTIDNTSPNDENYDSPMTEPDDSDSDTIFPNENSTDDDSVITELFKGHNNHG